MQHTLDAAPSPQQVPGDVLRRGKVLNVEQARFEKMLSSEQITNFVQGADYATLANAAATVQGLMAKARSSGCAIRLSRAGLH